MSVYLANIGNVLHDLVRAYLEYTWRFGARAGLHLETASQVLSTPHGSAKNKQKMLQLTATLERAEARQLFAAQKLSVRGCEVITRVRGEICDVITI